MINKQKLLNVLSIMLLISISILIFSLVYKSKLPMIVEQINNGTIGVILTAIVTVFLLGQQTHSEEVKDRNSKVFEKKLAVYHNFIQELEKIIQDGKITYGENGEKDELASLLFQLAQVRMHTGKTKVAEILQSVSKINENVSVSQKTIASSINHKHLAERLFSIVDTLRRELYSPVDYKEKASDEDSPLIVKQINESLDDIIRWAKASKDSEEERIVSTSKNEEEISSENDRIEIVKNFQQVLLKKIKEKFPEDTWECKPESEQNLNVSLRKKSWSEQTCVGIYDYDEDRLHFAAKYNWSGYYKDVYLLIRRDFGGRYNKYNWWLQLKEPYNKWDENDAGIRAFKDKDEGFIKYVVDSLSTIATKFDEIASSYEKVLQLQKDVQKTELMSNQLIYEANVLVHDYTLDGKTIAIDTVCSVTDGWEIYLFGRDDESMSYLHSLIVKYPTFKELFKDIKPNTGLYYRWFNPSEEINVVSESLQKLLTVVEAIIKTESNKTVS